MGKYVECYTSKKYDELIAAGYEFSHESNGVYYFINNDDLRRKIKFNKGKKFSENDIRESNMMKF